jgi:hypothetical protein
MGGFRVPKINTRVVVTLHDGASFGVTIFLSERAEMHPGPERLQEWLSGPARFLPAKVEESDRMLWLNRDSIRSVRAPLSLDQDHSAEATIPTEQEISLHLENGEVVTGLVAYVLPEYHSRLTDFLNGMHPFVRLVVGEDVLFINKREVLRVTASEA